MHERILRAIQYGWEEGEWVATVIDQEHPVFSLIHQGRRKEAMRAYRERTAAHEAGHILMGHVVGYRVEEAEIASIQQISDGLGGATLGYTAVGVPRHLEGTTIGAVCEVLHGLAGVVGTEVLYRDGWALDPSSWTPPEGMNESGLKEVKGGGDLWVVRETIKHEMRCGEAVLGKRTTVDALLAAVVQAEGILEGRRATLLRLSAALLQRGHLGRRDIADLCAIGD